MSLFDLPDVINEAEKNKGALKTQTHENNTTWAQENQTLVVFAIVFFCCYS